MPWVWASAFDAARMAAGAARPRAAAHPMSVRARRREITCEMVVSLMSELPERVMRGHDREALSSAFQPPVCLIIRHPMALHRGVLDALGQRLASLGPQPCDARQNLQPLTGGRLAAELRPKLARHLRSATTRLGEPHFPCAGFSIRRMITAHPTAGSWRTNEVSARGPIRTGRHRLTQVQADPCACRVETIS